VSPASTGSSLRPRRPCFELLCTNMLSETASSGPSQSGLGDIATCTASPHHQHQQHFNHHHLAYTSVPAANSYTSFHCRTRTAYLYCSVWSDVTCRHYMGAVMREQTAGHYPGTPLLTVPGHYTIDHRPQLARQWNKWVKHCPECDCSFIITHLSYSIQWFNWFNNTHVKWQNKVNAYRFDRRLV